MDVRCPNCETEYELDKGRLRPGGITVKCAQCTHVFRVRRRAESIGPQGTKKSAVVGNDEARSWLVRLGDGEIKVCRELATLQRWIVSGVVKPTSEISRSGKKWKELQELKELDAFFAIARDAKAQGSEQAPQRPHTIRRDSAPASVSDTAVDPSEVTTQETKSTLAYQSEAETVEMSPGEANKAIAEAEAKLGIYSHNSEEETYDTQAPTLVAGALPSALDETRAIPGVEKLTTKVQEGQGGPRMKRPKTVPPPAPGSRERRESEALALAAAQHASRGKSSAPPPIPKAAKKEAKSGAKNEVFDALAAAKASEARPASTPKSPARSSQNSSLGTKSRKSKPSDAAFAQEAAGRKGGASSVPKGQPVGPRRASSSKLSHGGMDVKEVAFAKRASQAVDVNETKASNDDSWLDSQDDATRASSAGVWIVLISLLVIGGAGAAMYFLLFQDDGGDAQTVAVTTPDAAPPVVADAEVEPVLVPAEIGELVAAALTRHDQREMLDLLTELDKEEAQPQVVIAKVALNNALAQYQLDEALFSNGSAAARNSAATRAGKKSLDWLGSLEESSGAERRLLYADAQRLAGTPSRAVERALRRADASEELHAERDYLRALLYARDRRLRDADALLDGLEKDERSLRIRFRQGVLALAKKDRKVARVIAEEILAVDSEHTGAAALLKASREEEKVANMGDTQESPTSGGSSSSQSDTSSQGNASSSSSASPASYDDLLERADNLAISGRCQQAVKSYEKALDQNPSGVAALTGLGYCHLEFKNFASAQARFRAALGISSRYQDALWGVAEGYQQQGLKDKAIAGYRQFIDEHPTSRRAEMAKRQVERLGGTVEEGAAPEDQPGGRQPDEGRPPAPKPNPKPETAGSEISGEPISDDSLEP